ncbi:MAG TPA: 50S ribosomal protein L23 [Planctomycetota bacterium]|nr:50S ribosomal protein L23 [Planctomycetota bacterium]
MKNPWEIIRKPLVTEKSMAKQQKGVYTFIVAREATKPEIKNAVEQAFRDKNIRVGEVRVVNVKGKSKRMKNQVLEGRRRDWKKAYVTLVEGRLDII